MQLVRNPICSCCFAALGSAHMSCSVQMSVVQATLQNVSLFSLLKHISEQEKSAQLQTSASVLLSVHHHRAMVVCFLFVDVLSSQDQVRAQYSTCAHMWSSSITKSSSIVAKGHVESL